VLDIDNRSVKVIESENSSQKVQLEEESILYEEPKITDPLGELQHKEITVLD
jgi:hypothetical protein